MRYSTWNALDRDPSVEIIGGYNPDDQLRASGGFTSTYRNIRDTIGLPASGNYYWETTETETTFTSVGSGIALASEALSGGGGLEGVVLNSGSEPFIYSVPSGTQAGRYTEA